VSSGRDSDEFQAAVPAFSSSSQRTAFGILTPTHWVILPATPTAAHSEPLSVMRKDGFGQRVQVAQDVGPLSRHLGALHPAEERVAQHQG